jgi:hypothetical protein
MAFMAGIKQLGMSQAGRGAASGAAQPTGWQDIQTRIGGSDGFKAPQLPANAVSAENDASPERSPQQPGPMSPDAGPGPKVSPQVYASIGRVLRAAEFNQKEAEFGQQLSANLEKSPLMDRGRSMDQPVNRKR